MCVVWGEGGGKLRCSIREPPCKKIKRPQHMKLLFVVPQHALQSLFALGHYNNASVRRIIGSAGGVLLNNNIDMVLATAACSAVVIAIAALSNDGARRSTDRSLEHCTALRCKLQTVRSTRRVEVSQARTNRATCLPNSPYLVRVVEGID